MAAQLQEPEEEIALRTLREELQKEEYQLPERWVESLAREVPWMKKSAATLTHLQEVRYGLKFMILGTASKHVYSKEDVKKILTNELEIPVNASGGKMTLGALLERRNEECGTGPTTPQLVRSQMNIVLEMIMRTMKRMKLERDYGAAWGTKHIRVAQTTMDYAFRRGAFAKAPFSNHHAAKDVELNGSSEEVEEMGSSEADSSIAELAQDAKYHFSAGTTHANSTRNIPAASEVITVEDDDEETGGPRKRKQRSFEFEYGEEETRDGEGLRLSLPASLRGKRIRVDVTELS